MKSAAFGFIVLLSFTTRVWSATLEFSGYLQTDAGTKFVVTETETARSSGWLTIGQAFNGYTILGFDPKREVLSVRNETSTLQLPLKVARVNAAKEPAMDVAAELAAAKRTLAELRKRYRDAHPEVQR